MQNYTFLFKHRLFPFLLGVFYEADAASVELKKNPPRKELDGNPD
ncbi:hypothetical protein [Flavobacterium sp. 2]